MSPSRCSLCFQPSIEFPQEFKAVLSDFIRVFNKFQQSSFDRSEVTKLNLCRPCWIYFMQIHKLHEQVSVKKENCYAKSRLLSFKIRRAQSSPQKLGNNLTSCEEFDVQILAEGHNDKKDTEIGGQTEGGDSVIVGGCSSNKPDDSDIKIAGPSSTSSASVSATLVQIEPDKGASADLCDFESLHPEPSSLAIAYENQWLPQNLTIPESSSVVKRLSEVNFTYLRKYPFEATDGGFKCGLCPAICGFYKSQPPLWYNILRHMSTRHKGNCRETVRKNCQRLIEVAPNRFQYGKYFVQTIDDNYMCEKCGVVKPPRTKYKAANILEHINRIHENPSTTHICENCGIVFKSLQRLRDHRLTKHETPGDTFPCSDCDKTFVSRTKALRHHKVVHQGIYKGRKFICEICGKECSTKIVLENHVAFVHNGKKIQCKDCGKLFASQVALSTHRNSHTGKKYTCDICGMEFTQHYSVTRHKKTAHPE